mmetsp:Transcript_5291/g.17124  ORF Transcript_5291/g.17124 Transcript_5291/m.17124 type:complete len:107 (+) Transcript_5291:399-719(+)
MEAMLSLLFITSLSLRWQRRRRFQPALAKTDFPLFSSVQVTSRWAEWTFSFPPFPLRFFPPFPLRLIHLVIQDRAGQSRLPGQSKTEQAALTALVLAVKIGSGGEH